MRWLAASPGRRLLCAAVVSAAALGSMSGCSYLKWRHDADALKELSRVLDAATAGTTPAKGGA